MNRLSKGNALSFLLAVGTVLATLPIARGQGTITFNGAASFSGTDYYESGMWFHTVIPPGKSITTAWQDYRRSLGHPMFR